MHHGNEVTVTVDNQGNWYDYVNKKWANAKTADGSYWVWIPRYEYKIPTPHTSTVQLINVSFIQDTNLAVDSGYIMHPGFKFGTTELTGIWVAKFEASGTTSAVDVKPNATSLMSITIGDIFTTCRNMEINTRYGWGTSGAGIDSHLMKNIEWGACSYLSSSQYGKIGEVWINPYYYHKTGRAGKSVNAGATTSMTTTYAYNDTTYGINASTTGNIYGIYDMSGGTCEYTAAYVNNGSTNLSYGSSLIAANAKYKDVYVSSGDTCAGNYAAASNKKGDAIYEISSDIGYAWYSDCAIMPNASCPFFERGGGYDGATSSGTFAFSDGDGSSNSYIGFRPVIVMDSSL